MASLILQMRSFFYAPVAQLDRALVSGTRGQGFESLRARHELFIVIHYDISLKTAGLG